MKPLKIKIAVIATTMAVLFSPPLFADDDDMLQTAVAQAQNTVHQGKKDAPLLSVLYLRQFELKDQERKIQETLETSRMTIQCPLDCDWGNLDGLAGCVRRYLQVIDGTLRGEHAPPLETTEQILSILNALEPQSHMVFRCPDDAGRIILKKCWVAWDISSPPELYIDRVIETLRKAVVLVKSLESVQGELKEINARIEALTPQQGAKY